MRMNSLQERVDLLAVKVTQLDSTVEEGGWGQWVVVYNVGALTGVKGTMPDVFMTFVF